MTSQAIARGPAVTALWRQLFDDAAIFPPGNEPLDRAVPAHLTRRQTGDAEFVGPFLILGSGLRRLADVLPRDVRGFDISLIEREVGAVEARLAEVSRQQGVAVRAVEVVALPGEVDRTADVLQRVLPAAADGYVEIPFSERLETDTAQLAGAGLRAKFRTGGMTAKAFPDETQLAAAIKACAIADVPFKLTAGLHHALRYRDQVTGFEHHGLLNIIAAVDLAKDGAGPAAIAVVLGVRNPATLVRAISRFEDERADRVRSMFTAVGTCSISEPLEELRAHGLLPVGAG